LNVQEFKFPEKEELKIFIKDILEPVVGEKYYLSEKMQERFAKYLADKEQSVCAMRGRNPDNSKSRVSGLPTEQQLEFKEDGCSNTLTNVQKDNLVYENKIKREQLDISGKGYSSQQDRLYYDTGIMGCLPNANPTNKVNVILSEDVPMISNTLTTELAHSTGRDYKDPKIISGRLRRLTPKECFRLQGFLNDEVDLEGLSDTQCYRLAGNGQSVNVVEKILKEMFK
jgi:DNA (cytosine-5)-methyltransferase 1